MLSNLFVTMCKCDLILAAIVNFSHNIRYYTLILKLAFKASKRLRKAQDK